MEVQLTSGDYALHDTTPLSALCVNLTNRRYKPAENFWGF